LEELSPKGYKSDYTLILTTGRFLSPGYAYISRKTARDDDGDEYSLQNYAYLVIPNVFTGLLSTLTKLVSFFNKKIHFLSSFSEQ